ncbi:MAG: hypothetical protein COV99_11630 [Bacteroidetes bacterium CG12_big_fil_rev_8_21_14_0_65_60_17]|nr:MAG: hypothetical protein COV99_11630 [Bacteroidetes bacterium CG12_big_fil_rev_8_21_14_0_65_60_17]
MYVVKYFFEEPAPMGLGHRGYVAATDLDTQRMGASVLPETLTRLISGLLPSSGRTCYWSNDGSGTAFAGRPGVAFDDLLASDGEFSESLSAALTKRVRKAMIVAGPYRSSDHGEAVAMLLEHGIRDAAPQARALIEDGLTLLFPEPSHDGQDWAIHSPVALSGTVRALLAEMAGRDLEAYVIPFQKARAEHKFYFELYDRMLFDDFRVAALV